MINLESKDLVKQNQFLSMFLIKCTNQDLGSSFKLQFCSKYPCSEYAPVDLTDRQMINGLIKCHKKSMNIGKDICFKELFQKIYTSSLSVLRKTMVEDAQQYLAFERLLEGF